MSRSEASASRLELFLQNIDRRIIYLIVAVSLSIPLILETSLRPAPMRSAQDYFNTVESIAVERKQLILVALDWQPSTKAENGSQTEATLEHLMRRRLPFAVITLSPFAAPLLEAYPRAVIEKMKNEDPAFAWDYGTHWVNLGYQPNAGVLIQNIARSNDLSKTLKTDANGTPLEHLAIMDGIKTIRDIPVFIQLTSLVGTLNTWLQFLQTVDYRPKFLHGCTSITIPEAYIYYSSKQLMGLHEGLAGAAAYEEILSEKYPQRTIGSALKLNTSLAIAQLSIVGLIILGNTGYLLNLWRRRRS